MASPTLGLVRCSSSAEVGRHFVPLHANERVPRRQESPHRLLCNRQLPEHRLEETLGLSPHPDPARTNANGDRENGSGRTTIHSSNSAAAPAARTAHLSAQLPGTAAASAF